MQGVHAPAMFWPHMPEGMPHSDNATDPSCGPASEGQAQASAPQPQQPEDASYCNILLHMAAQQERAWTNPGSFQSMHGAQHCAGWAEHPNKLAHSDFYREGEAGAARPDAASQRVSLACPRTATRGAAACMYAELESRLSSLASAGSEEPDDKSVSPTLSNVVSVENLTKEERQERRKIQNRHAQRRRRLRNIILDQCTGSTIVDRLLDPALQRRRKRSSDFKSETEQMEWRRHQNREAKRRHRERRKSDGSIDSIQQPLSLPAQLPIEIVNPVPMPPCHKEAGGEGGGGDSFQYSDGSYPQVGRPQLGFPQDGQNNGPALPSANQAQQQQYGMSGGMSGMGGGMGNQDDNPAGHFSAPQRNFGQAPQGAHHGGGGGGYA